MKRVNDRLLTRAEVAQIFKVSPSTVTRWAEAGKLPSVKTLGGHRRYEAKLIMKLAQHRSEEKTMQKISITVPAMYGDHHVLEVRRILLQLPGVAEVNASSCFHTVEVSFDPARLTVEQIEASLAETGYLDELPVPAESGTAVTQRNGGEKPFFRHTAAYEQTKHVVGFGQEISYAGRPLWPCPGIGVIKQTEIEPDVRQKEVTGG